MEILRHVAARCELSVSRQPPTPHLSSGNGVARLPGRNSGQKAQKGPQKKNFWPNFGWFYQKQAEKGPQKIFKRCSLFLAVITVINLIFNIQYTNFLRPLFCLFLVKISQNSARNFFLWPLLSFLVGISAWQPCNTISWTACILNWEENYSGGGCHFSGRFIFARSVFDAQMS